MLLLCFVQVCLFTLLSAQSAIEAFRAALAEPDSKLDVPAALFLLNGTSAATLCRTPLGPGVPTLHWLLNLYFRSREQGARRGLVQVLQRCVESHDADVMESFNNDPSVLVKALLLREMSLAKTIASRAQGGLNAKAVFAGVGATPGKNVTLSLAFARAGVVTIDAIIRDKRDTYANVTSGAKLTK